MNKINKKDTENFEILRKIYKEKGLTQRKLAHELGYSLGKLNFIVNELKKKGLIKIMSLKLTDSRSYGCQREVIPCGGFRGTYLTVVSCFFTLVTSALLPFSHPEQMVRSQKLQCSCGTTNKVKNEQSLTQR